MLSESLRAVISQALLKKVGGGRTAAWEIMVGTPAIRNLIREDKVAQMYSAIQTGQNVRHDDPGPAPAGPGEARHGQSPAGEGIREGQAPVRMTNSAVRQDRRDPEPEPLA
jgi:hypothetical protein